ncbi:YbaB/EbfC family nucleoid-associated protein [Austwickia chelonae]|uniref:YbaB/EbfC family nucleoid-associated protein n=1 Tax=Austwickia chelonae TaxID=100225 RepID=UPI000E256088|nr:YbaB/EbfC family nucleoid-associated protein [Austwickia chelonae]
MNGREQERFGMTPEIDEITAVAEGWREQYDNIREQVSQAKVTGSSPCGGVRVEMASGANIVGIRFSEEILRKSPSAVESAVMAAIKEATTSMSALMQEAVSPYLTGFDAGAIASGGFPTGLAEAFENDYHQRKEKKADPEPPQPSQPQAAPRPPGGAPSGRAVPPKDRRRGGVDWFDDEDES